jgi:fatty-acyl-CoA synthase
LKAHPAVFDVLVVGRPSARWGQEVTAVVAVRPGRTVTLEDLREVGGRHLARYKLPRVLLTVDAVQRSPSGKPDYAWARELVASPT